MYKRHQVGLLGENASVSFLMKHRFEILSRNYRKKYGEIDIIAQKDQKIYFVEVKTVSCEIKLVDGRPHVIHKQEAYRVEENVHSKKIRSLFITLQIYLAEMKISEDREWQLDVHIVYLDVLNKRAKVDVISNITN